MTIKTIPMGTIGTNCYVIYDDNGTAAIVDCDGRPGPLFRFIEANHLKPTHILLTHGHFDHIGAVPEVKEKYGCIVCAGAKESRVLADPAINSSLYYGTPLSIQPDLLLEDGDTVQVGTMRFQVLFTPGHTEGSICYIVENNIISGDTLFQGSCGRTDLPTGDWNTILQSLKRLKELDGEYLVFPGHGPATTLNTERRYNPFM